MTQEEEQLLLRDLCSRLPYGVMVHFEGWDPEELLEINLRICVSCNGWGGLPIPYLRPMSSMTKDEINEFIQISDSILEIGEKKSTCILSLEQIDWLNEHHFDYRINPFTGKTLIESDLAFEAPEGMYKTK